MVYKQPGVQSSEVNISQLVTGAGGVQKPGVVGTGTNFLLVNDQEVVRGSGSTDTLPSTLTGQIFSVSTVSSQPGLGDFVLGTNYTVIDNTIFWIANGPATGATYYVTYKKTKPASYYNAHVFFDINDMRAWYGNELENGEVRPITMAGKMLFDAGASQVTAVQQTTHSNSDLSAALEKLESEDIDILLVPGITAQDSSLTTVITHVNKMSGSLEGKERIALVGSSLFGASSTQIENQADPVNNEKIVFMSPPQVTISAKDAISNKDVTLAASVHYAAASLAGVMSDPNFDVAEPMLRKTLPGIVGITNYSRSVANSMASKGVLVLEQSGTEVKVRHDLTTYVGDANKEQISVVRTKFYTMKQWRTLLNDRFVGQKLLPETLTGMKLASVNFLNGLIRDKILNGFRGLSIVQSTTEPRMVECRVELAPVYPIVWISVVFGLYVA